MIAGNEYQAAVMTGRCDASYELLLKGNANKEFAAISPVASGFILNRDVKSMKLITNAKKQRLIIAGINDEYVKVFKIK